ncbi:hypothetical protein B0H66DRAFT_552522 [Apodospora peruviana]|uniref:Zn(2)-C6 fungal-type domain-containing protein n=1 Tax=Apodospora peruviana TaxID=516989 RepID=A0AAE0M727_9PEZI|nr:hypothetical protein B0H66DRAFT_552522 [Apodospora peruviana]
MKIRQMTTCHICRARKLACDGKVPACTQCALSGRTCPGYQHDLIFRPPVVAGLQQTTARVVKRRRNSSFTGFEAQRHPSRGSTNLAKRSAETADAEQQPYRKLITVFSPPSWPLLDIISLVIQNFSPLGVYERMGLVSADSGVSSQRICGAWVEALPELSRDERAERFLSPSIKTLAVSMLSRGHDGRAPISDALATRALAVSSLRYGLQGRVGSSSNIFAAAVMCLFLSELILPTSKASATIHAQGIRALLQLQSPESYSSGVGHQLFVGVRPVLFIQSLLSRQNTFLAEEGWLMAPFSISGATPLQDLFSEVVTLPSTLGMIEELKEMPKAQADTLALTAFEKLSQSLNGLVRMSEAIKDGDQDLYQFILCPIEEDTDIHFPSLTVANLFTHIWAFHIVCARHITQLTCFFPSIRGQLDPRLERLISTEIVIHLSSLILRSMKFLTLEKFKLFGAASTTLPLHVAHEVLVDEGRDNEELSSLYQRVLRMYCLKGYQYMVEQVP